MNDIKYKHLWAWDRMMGSTIEYSQERQAKAAAENAPEDAIYRDLDGTWRRFENVTAQTTRDRISEFLKEVP